MHRFALNHVRLIASVIVALAVILLLPRHWSFVPRVLTGWNCGVTLFLLLIYQWMRSLSAEQICSRFIEEDESAPVILVVVIVAALLSVVAIVALLSTIRQVAGDARTAHFALSALTVANSWLLVPTMYALHYADMFYSEPAGERPLQFPRTDMPVFWDFAYFSFTIAAACQTSDVSTLNSSMRKTVLVHTVISFFFNATILGFAINITAGLFSGN